MAAASFKGLQNGIAILAFDTIALEVHATDYAQYEGRCISYLRDDNMSSFELLSVDRS